MKLVKTFKAPADCSVQYRAQQKALRKAANHHKTIFIPDDIYVVYQEINTAITADYPLSACDEHHEPITYTQQFEAEQDLNNYYRTHMSTWLFILLYRLFNY